jgi:hypothetical protein
VRMAPERDNHLRMALQLVKKLPDLGPHRRGQVERPAAPGQDATLP